MKLHLLTKINLVFNMYYVFVLVQEKSVAIIYLTAVAFNTSCIVLMVLCASIFAVGLMVRLKSNTSPFLPPLGNKATGHSNTWWQSDTNKAKPSVRMAEIYSRDVTDDLAERTSRNAEDVDNTLSFSRAVGGCWGGAAVATGEGGKGEGVVVGGAGSTGISFFNGDDMKRVTPGQGWGWGKRTRA